MLDLISSSSFQVVYLSSLCPYNCCNSFSYPLLNLSYLIGKKLPTRQTFYFIFHLTYLIIINSRYHLMVYINPTINVGIFKEHYRGTLIIIRGPICKS